MDGSALVHGGDFVVVTRRWHAKEIEKHLRSNRESVVQRSASGRSGSNGDRTAFQLHHAGVRRVGEGAMRPTHTVGQ